MRSNQPASILHLFEHACNLINASGEIVSLVDGSIGPGPFAIVVSTVPPLDFHINSESPVVITGNTINVGRLNIETASTPLWHPVPPWPAIRAKQEAWRGILSEQLNTNPSRVQSWGRFARVERGQLNIAAKDLLHGLSSRRVERVIVGARSLSGLGQGLTPAGDDFLLGVVYGLWATRSSAEARDMAGVIVETAAPRTTSLSAAWLGAAARGEAAKPWHDLFDGLLSNSSVEIGAAIDRLRSFGHSSGADALAGFSSIIGDVM